MTDHHQYNILKNVLSLNDVSIFSVPRLYNLKEETIDH